MLFTRGFGKRKDTLSFSIFLTLFIGIFSCQSIKEAPSDTPEKDELAFLRAVHARDTSVVISFLKTSKDINTYLLHLGAFTPEPIISLLISEPFHSKEGISMDQIYFLIGQSGSANSLSFLAQMAEKSPESLPVSYFEAWGKIHPDGKLPEVEFTSTEAKVKCIYALILRGFWENSWENELMEAATDTSTQVSSLAFFALQRARSLPSLSTESSQKVLAIFLKTKDENLQRAAALLLGKTNPGAVREAILAYSQGKGSKDGIWIYLLQAAMRQQMSSDGVLDLASKLQHPDAQKLAVNWALQSNTNKRKWENLSKSFPHWYAQEQLWQYALKNFPDWKFEMDMSENYFDQALEENPYALAAKIKMLAHDTRHWPLLDSLISSEGHHVIRNAALEGLLALSDISKKKPSSDISFEQILLNAFETMDMSLLALLASHLTKIENPEQVNFWKEKLQNTQSALQLPLDLEAWQEIELVLAKWENRSAHFPRESAWYFFPDKSEEERLFEPKQVIIQTDKGRIVIALETHVAAYSIKYFRRLVESGFYHQKKFHRVVPNFVIQGGCPRGDGYGSSLPMLRSEFSPTHYAAGTVGLASAGKDSESCQWFITLDQTPHLNGRYTIIGQVIEGLEVARQIEIGDKILSCLLE